MNSVELFQLRKLLIEDLFTRFGDPRTGMIYSYALPDRASALPTPEEVAAAIPSEPGWGTGVEDCAMNGGFLIAALAEMGEADGARWVFRGLRLLAESAAVPGFVPRGLLSDGRTHYRNSSVDQHTMYVYGLWRYFRSSLSTPEERQAIARIVHNVARRVEKNDFRILTEDGRPAIAGGNLTSLSPGVAARLLELLLAAYVVTGEPHWRNLYEQQAEENGHARLRGFCGLPDSGFPEGWGFYGPEQMQAQLRLVYESDWDDSRRALYSEAMAEVARRMLTMGFPTAGHTPAYTEETLKILGESAYLTSPFDWTRYNRKLLCREEDWTWRADFARRGRCEPGHRWALDFVTGWMGRRPAFCHERNCVRFPLTAFHVALVGGDSETRVRVRSEALRLLATVDFSCCRWADTLVEAISVLSLIAPGDPKCSRNV